MSTFQSELEAAHCTMPVEEVREILIQVLREGWPGWSDDDLLDRPCETDIFRDAVRDRLGNQHIQGDLISRILVDSRKQSGFPKEMVSRSRLPPLARQLTDAACGMQVEEFEAAIVQVFVEKYADNFSSETIRYRTDIARRYCDDVRDLIRCGSVDNFLILRSLGNLRKQGRLADLMSA